METKLWMFYWSDPDDYGPLPNSIIMLRGTEADAEAFYMDLIMEEAYYAFCVDINAGFCLYCDPEETARNEVEIALDMWHFTEVMEVVDYGN